MAKSKTTKKLWSLMLSCCIALGNVVALAADTDETFELPEESRLQDIINDDFTKLSGKEDAEIREALTGMGYTIDGEKTDSLTFSATEDKGLYMKRTGTSDALQIQRAISDDNGITKDNTLLPNHNMKGGGKYYVDYTFSYDQTGIYINGAGNWKNVFCRTQINNQDPKKLIVYGATGKYEIDSADAEMHVQTVVDTKTGNATGATPQCVSNVFVNGDHVAVNADNRYDYEKVAYYTTFLQNMSFLMPNGSIAVDGGGLYLKNFRVSKIVETDSEMAEGDKDALTLTKTDAIIKDFTLPTKGSANGSTITWESSNPNVISISEGNAVVTRPDNDTEVTLTATITKGEASVTKEFTVTVNGAAVPEVEPGTNLALGKTASGSAEPYGDTYNYSKITDGDTTTTRLALNDWANLANEYIDVDLGADYTFNKIKIMEFQGRLRKFKLQYSLDKVTWTDIGEYTNSDNYKTAKNWDLDFNDVTGRYVRILIKENAVIDSSHYLGASIWEFEVYNRIIPDEERAEKDKNALTLAKTDAIISDFTLPTTGSVNGSIITWESSNPAVISISEGNAVVTRPENDTKVTLTATITKGEASVTKEFTVTVNGAAVPEVEQGTNLALGKTASGSAEPYGDTYNYSKITDGDTTTTRLALNDWANLANEYIDVDLGADYTFNKIKIMEFQGRLRKFKLQYSLDKVTWTDIGEYTNSDNYQIAKNWDLDFKAITGRYVRILIEENAVIDSSHYLGASIWEFEVYYMGKSYVKNLSYTSENGHGSISYERGLDAADSNIYTAVYNSKKELVYVAINNTSGSFDCDPSETYTFKAFVWDGQGNMQSMCEPIEG